MNNSGDGALCVDPRFEISLREGERELRTDVVVASEMLQAWWLRERSASTGRLALVTLTSERLIFRPPAVDWDYRFDAYLMNMLLNGRRGHPLTRVVEFELAAIVRIWTWQPEFSAPPALQFGAELVPIDLRVDERPWTHRASVDEIREHVDAIRGAIADLGEQHRHLTG